MGIEHCHSPSRCVTPSRWPLGSPWCAGEVGVGHRPRGVEAGRAHGTGGRGTMAVTVSIAPLRRVRQWTLDRPRGMGRGRRSGR
jgi:hypothetical protein